MSHLSSSFMNRHNQTESALLNFWILDAVFPRDLFSDYLENAVHFE